LHAGLGRARRRPALVRARAPAREPRRARPAVHDAPAWVRYRPALRTQLAARARSAALRVLPDPCVRRTVRHVLSLPVPHGAGGRQCPAVGGGTTHKRHDRHPQDRHHALRPAPCPSRARWTRVVSGRGRRHHGTSIARREPQVQGDAHRSLRPARLRPASRKPQRTQKAQKGSVRRLAARVRSRSVQLRRRSDSTPASESRALRTTEDAESTEGVGVGAEGQSLATVRHEQRRFPANLAIDSHLRLPPIGREDTFFRPSGVGARLAPPSEAIRQDRQRSVHGQRSG
jgi:hypothetical protein